MQSRYGSICALPRVRIAPAASIDVRVRIASGVSHCAAMPARRRSRNSCSSARASSALRAM
jgi:hypothetical protein